MVPVVIIIVSHEWQVGEYINDSLTTREEEGKRATEKVKSVKKKKKRERKRKKLSPLTRIVR